MKNIKRIQELNILESFVKKEGSGFLYIRGRRRIGKSWLLNEFQSLINNSFLFTGAKDSNSHNTVKNFAERWSNFSKNHLLIKIKSSELSWHLIFDEVTKHALNINKTLTLIFDEIQWIASEIQ